MEFAIGIILLCLFFVLWLTVLTYKLYQKKHKNQYLREQNEHLKNQNMMLKRYLNFEINGKEEPQKD